MTLTVPAAALCVCVCPRARAWGMSSSAQLLLLSSSSSSSSSPLHSSCVHVVKGGAAPLTLLTVAYSSERSASSTPPGLPPPLRSSKLHVTPRRIKTRFFFFGEILPRFFFPTKLALSRGFKRAAWLSSRCGALNVLKPRAAAVWTRGGTRCLRFGCADLGALRTGSSIQSASSSEETERTGGGGRETPQQRGREDGPECNFSVFPQETEPEAGRGGAGEPEHLKTWVAELLTRVYNGGMIWIISDDKPALYSVCATSQRLRCIWL